MSKRLASAAQLEERLAAVEGDDWDSASENGDEINNDDSIIPLRETRKTRSQIDAGPQRVKSSDKNPKANGLSSVVYVGHIPHGFYEEQMMGFFSQFGEVTKLRLSRSKKTGGSRGYAFVEFKDASDTKIVAESMDKYLLSGKQLVVKQLPQSKVHPRLFEGAKERFHTFPLREHHAQRVNKVLSWPQNCRIPLSLISSSIFPRFKPKSEAERVAINARLTRKEAHKRKSLAALGLDYSFPGYAASSSHSAKSSTETSEHKELKDKNESSTQSAGSKKPRKTNRTRS